MRQMFSKGQIEKIIGDSQEYNDLVQDISNLTYVVGDNESGLVKEVNDLSAIVGNGNMIIIQEDMDNPFPRSLEQYIGKKAIYYGKAHITDNNKDVSIKVTGNIYDVEWDNEDGSGSIKMSNCVIEDIDTSGCNFSLPAIDYFEIDYMYGVKSNKSDIYYDGSPATITESFSVFQII